PDPPRIPSLRIEEERRSHLRGHDRSHRIPEESTMAPAGARLVDPTCSTADGPLRLLRREHHEAVREDAARGGRGEGSVQLSEPAIERSGQPAQSGTMEHRRRDEVRDAVKAPRPKAGEPGLAEPAVELASREEPERRVARVVDPDALAQRTRERSGGLTRRDAVPEWVAGDARR